MNDHRVSSFAASHRGLCWAIFCGVSVLALSAGVVVAALATGSRSSVAVVLLIGLIVVGIAAALMESIISPLQNLPDGSRGAGGVVFGPGDGASGGDGG